VVRCSPFDNFVCVPDWSGSTSVLEIMPQNPQNPFRDVVSLPSLNNSINLCCSWSEKGKVVLGDNLGTLKLWDCNTNAQTALNVQHAAPVKDVVFNEHLGCFLSSG